VEKKRLSVAEFQDVFQAGGVWGLLVGSAVSAARPSAAPLVEPALHGLLSSFAAELADRNSLFGRKTSTLFRSIRQQRLAANLKFENALSHVDGHVPDLSATLVNALYGDCLPNRNHEAAARLYRQHRVQWLITTNLDGGLEQAAHARVVTKLPQEGSILKLHGDAATKTDLVHTMRGLTTGRNTRLAYGALKAMQGLGLTDLLIVGYSGSGDIDIFPALVNAAKEGLRIWWSVKTGNAPEAIHVEGTVEHDLRDPARNLLCLLAELDADSDELKFPTDENAQSLTVEKFGPVARALDERALTHIVVSLLMEANFGWQPAKLLFLSERLLGLEVDHELWHFACERMSAYSDAAEHLTRGSATADPQELAKNTARIAFLLQEAGRTQESRAAFGRAASELSAIKDDELTFETQDFVLRGQLESQVKECLAKWKLTDRQRTAYPVDGSMPGTTANRRVRSACRRGRTETQRSRAPVRVCEQRCGPCLRTRSGSGCPIGFAWLTARRRRCGREPVPRWCRWPFGLAKATNH
jgi:hypothetical protein